jgi:predicted neutral ceramidase superfamily lipid hydrolase
VLQIAAVSGKKFPIGCHTTCPRTTIGISFFVMMLKTNVMSDLLYVLAVILIIGWILGAFVFSVGGLIHILLVVAIIAILLRLIRGRSI